MLPLSIPPPPLPPSSSLTSLLFRPPSPLRPPVDGPLGPFCPCVSFKREIIPFFSVLCCSCLHPPTSVLPLIILPLFALSYPFFPYILLFYPSYPFQPLSHLLSYINTPVFLNLPGRGTYLLGSLSPHSSPAVLICSRAEVQWMGTAREVLSAYGLALGFVWRLS